MYPVFLLSLLVFSTRAFSLTVVTDPFSILEDIKGFPKSPPSRVPCTLKNCPEPLKELNSKASDSLIYRMVSGEYPLEKCLEGRRIYPVEDLKGVYTKTLNISEDSPLSYPVACAPGVSSSGRRQSLLFTQQQYYRERLNRGANQSLLALHEIDSFLMGSPSVVKGIKCDSGISSRAKKKCRQLKKCPRNSQQGALVELTYTSLKRKHELQGSLDKINSKISSMNPRSKEYQEKIQHLKGIRDTLKGSIAEIKNVIPWVDGRFFEKSIGKIKKSIVKEEEADSVKKEIEAGMIRQFQANKKELVRTYDQFSEAAGCLDGKENCDRFFKIVSKAPSALPEVNPYSPPLSPDIQSAYDQFEIVQCLENEIDAATNYKGIAQGTGEIALGLTIGGFGGIWGLAANSVKILKSGYRIKAGMSMLGLGTLGVTTYKNFNFLKATCKEASRHLVGMKDGDSKNACIPKTYPQNVSRYLSCLTELALTGAAIIPPIMGEGIKLGSKAKLKIAKGGGQKIDKIEDVKDLEDMKDFQALMNVDQFDNFSRLLDEFKGEERRMIRPYLQQLKEKKLDALTLHRALRFSRTLSAKKRNVFLNRLDEVFSGDLNSDNRMVKKFLVGERRYAKRVVRLEKKYRKQLPSDVAQESATEAAKRESHRIEDVLLSCRSRTMNASHQRSISLFSKMTTGLMGVSITSGFANANWHLPKDKDWFGRLGYELVYALMYTKILVKVMKDPSGSLLRRYGQFTKGGTIVEGIDSAMYSQFLFPRT